MPGPCCNATITWQKPLSIPREAVGGWWGWPKKELSWPFHGFQPPRTVRRLVFAVSLKFLISIDFLRNVLSYANWHKAWNLCTGSLGHASRQHCCWCNVAWKTLISFSWDKLPNHPLCSWIGTSMAWCIGISCGTLARQHFADNFRYQDDNTTPHRSRVGTDYLQQEENLQRLVAIMPWRLAVIIRVKYTRY